MAVNDDYIILAARLQDSPGSQQGAVYVYDAATRQELYKLTAFDGELLDYFGSDVALAGDTLLVGASGDDSNRGAAYLYDLPTGNLIRKIVASDGEPEDFFGVAVAISGDRERIRVIVDNMMSNAVKFSPKGGTITVTMSRDGDLVQLDIADEGPGVPEEELDKIFTAFFQGSA